MRTPRWTFTLVKSGLRICSREQNRHHRCVDPLRNHGLVRIDSHHSKPFLPEKSRYFGAFFGQMKKRSSNAQETAESTSDGTDDGRTPLSSIYWSTPEVFSTINHLEVPLRLSFVLLPSGCFWPSGQSHGQNRPELDYFGRQKRSKKSFRICL